MSEIVTQILTIGQNVILQQARKIIQEIKPCDIERSEPAILDVKIHCCSFG